MGSMLLERLLTSGVWCRAQCKTVEPGFADSRKEFVNVSARQTQLQSWILYFRQNLCTLFLREQLMAECLAAVVSLGSKRLAISKWKKYILQAFTKHSGAQTRYGAHDGWERKRIRQNDERKVIIIVK